MSSTVYIPEYVVGHGSENVLHNRDIGDLDQSIGGPGGMSRSMA